MKQAISFLIILAGAKCCFAQDTTGGTRANVIIPLHSKHTTKTAAKKDMPYVTDTLLPNRSAVNSDESNLQKAVAGKKYRGNKRKNVNP